MTKKAKIIFRVIFIVLWPYVSTLTCQINVQQILLFLGEKNTYTTLLGTTCLLISDIFPSKLIFTYINEKKCFLHALIKTYTFINFWEICHLNDPIKWSYTIIWQVRVLTTILSCFQKKKSGHTSLPSSRPGCIDLTNYADFSSSAHA